MKASLQVSVMAGALPEGRASAGSLEARRLEETDALWKSVFDRARPADAGGADALHHSRSPASFIRRAQDRTAQVAGAAQQEFGVEGAIQGIHGPRSFTNAAAVRTGSAAPLAPTIAGTSADTMPVAGATAGFVQVAAEPVKTDEPTKMHVAAMPAEPQLDQVASADAAMVFVQGDAVSIVVRDARISAQEALQTAFEAARALTGERGSLQRLTLNGRTLYCKAHDEPALAPSALLFVC